MRALQRAAFSLLLLAVVCLAAGAALAEKRVALLMGNSKYLKAAALINPVNDAALIAESFKAAGFDHVDLSLDLKIAGMRRALRDFNDRTRDADVAVVHYAGHGIEVDGIDYLVPVDAVLERDVDIYDEALPLKRALVSVEPARQLRFIILDACRDNPFARTMSARWRSGRSDEGWPRSSQQPEHADRVSLESRLDSIGRRWNEQYVHDGAGEPHH